MMAIQRTTPRLRPRGSLLCNGSAYSLSAASPFNPSTQDFTAALWFLTTSMAANNNLLAQQDGGGTGRTWIAATTGLVLESVIGGVAINGSTTLSTNTWYHALVTKAGTTVTGYLNGVQELTATATAESAAGAMVFGAGKTLVSGLVGNGTLCRIWNRPLSLAEIRGEYRGLGPRAGLVLEYLCGEGGGAKTFDTSSSANPGTITTATYSNAVPNPVV